MNEVHLDLSPEEVDRIVNSLGYGPLSASVWFIGLEEGLGKMTDEDIANNFKARGNFESVMDLYEAHLRLQERGKPIDIETRLKFTQAWQYMAKIMLARNGNRDWKDKSAVMDYIRLKLGREHGDTFLTEYSPIPTRRTTDKKWMRWFEKRDPELHTKIKNRNDELKRILKVSEPKPLVICYGRGNQGEHFSKLLDVKWRPINSKISISGDFKCLLLPFFGNGQMGHAVIETLLREGLLSK